MGIQDKEVKLIELNVHRKTILYTAAGLSLVDGGIHIARGFGYILDVFNLNQMLTVTGVINYTSIAWGFLMLGMGGLLLYIVLH